MSLRVLCDENIPLAVIASLKKRGFNVRVVESGISDDEVAARAKREKRIIITFDSDFANILKYPPGDFRGIIRLNIHPQFYSAIIKALQNVFDKFTTPEDFRGKLIIAEFASFRIWREAEEEIEE